MAIGVITGSGTYALPGLEAEPPRPVETRWGTALVSRGEWAGTEVVHLSRHGEGHPRLSNHVEHRANVAALHDAGARAVLAVTVCGAVDPRAELGSLVCFDDLHFLANRLPGGELCTFHAEPGAPGRGHWVYEGPFSPEGRRALLDGAEEAGVPVRDGGCYGHVDGPRFNTRAEIRGLAAAGVSAVSQTAGPETVLCGELELPYALLGFLTDYANGVRPEPTPVDALLAHMRRSTGVFAAVLRAAVPRLAAAAPRPPGVVLRFGAA